MHHEIWQKCTSKLSCNISLQVWIQIKCCVLYFCSKVSLAGHIKVMFYSLVLIYLVPKLLVPLVVLWVIPKLMAFKETPMWMCFQVMFCAFIDSYSACQAMAPLLFPKGVYSSTTLSTLIYTRIVSEAVHILEEPLIGSKGLQVSVWVWGSG